MPLRRTRSSIPLLGAFILATLAAGGACVTSSDTLPPGADAGFDAAPPCTVGCDASTTRPDAAARPDASDAGVEAEAAVDAPSDAPADTADASSDAPADTADAGFVLGPNDHVVDPAAGLDTNPGTLALPFKTLGKAMTTGTPVNVYLADGTYDTTTQGSSPIAVPNGVAVRALNAGGATLKGIPLVMTGGGTLAGVDLDGLTQVTATSSTGAPTLTLTGVRIRSTNDALTVQATLMLGGAVHATLTPGALPGGLYTFATGAVGPVAVLHGSSQLLVQGGTFDGNSGVGLGLFSVLDTASATFDGVTLKNLGLVAGNGGCAAIRVAGSSVTTPAALTLRGGSVIDNVTAANVVQSCPGVQVDGAASLTVDNATIRNGGSYAIATGASASGVSVTLTNGAAITGNAYGVGFFTVGGTNTLTITGASVTGNVNGGSIPALRAQGSGTIAIDISQLTATGNTGGATFTPTTFKARNSSFSSNTVYGLALYGTPTTVDLGTAGSLGGNTIASNGNTNLYTLTGGTIDAVGNTWEPSIQGADAAGHFTSPTQKVGAQSGKNFFAVSGSTLNL